MKNHTKYRYNTLFIVDILSAIFAIVVGGLLIHALVFPYEIKTTDALATVGQLKISSARGDMDIDEKNENLKDFVQLVEDKLKGQIVVEKRLVTMSACLLIVLPLIFAWNAIEIGLILKNKKNLKNKRNDSPTDLKNSPTAIETEDEICEEDEPSPSANGDPEKGLMKSISI